MLLARRRIIALCSLLSATATSSGCLPEDLTFRPDEGPASSSTGSGGAGGACVEPTPDGGAAGAGGAAAPCVRCWSYAISGETADVCTCSAEVYQVYRDCICEACPDCTICSGNGPSDECSACYQMATEQDCQAVHQACLDD